MADGSGSEHTEAGREQAAADALPANQVYYVSVGVGDWDGRFTFALTDWEAFWRERIGLVDRFLSLWLIGTFKLIGWAGITSTLRRVDDAASATRVGNHVRIHRFGLTLYVLTETYRLDPNGRDVVVDASERFGPIPLLFRNRKRHTAEVLDGGMRAVYSLPLLGTSWTAVYHVRPDRRHVDSTMTGSWAEAHERIARLTA